MHDPIQDLAAHLRPLAAEFLAKCAKRPQRVGERSKYNKVARSLLYDHWCLDIYDMGRTRGTLVYAISAKGLQVLEAYEKLVDTAAASAFKILVDSPAYPY